MKNFYMIKKSAAASFLISLGVYCLLYCKYPVISAFLFSLGLFTICVNKLYLFTGKCGYILEDKNVLKTIIQILIVNLITGYLLGYIYSYTSNELIITSLERISTWSFSFSYFIKSCLCGSIMFIAVDLYNKGTSLGIFFGVPMFILSGFQHSIANIIILGCGRTFNISILLCIIGNLIGSLIIWFLLKKEKNNGE